MRLSPWLPGLLLVAMATGLRAEEKPANDAAKSANWLVDAMNEKSADPSDAAMSGRSRSNGSLGKASSYAQPQNNEANPLSSYLTTWMTPRDIEILKIKGDADSAPGTVGSLDKRLEAQSAPTAKPAPNPYLVDLEPSHPVSAKPLPPLPVPPAPSLAPAAPKNDAPPAKPPGPPPDLIKSQEDQKYFPQLKRF